MRLRAIHLASVLLLFASLGVAEGSALRDNDFSIGGHYISMLLGQDRGGISTQSEFNSEGGDALALDLPVASLALHRTVWTMRPPSAHCMELQAVTGFGV